MMKYQFLLSDTFDNTKKLCGEGFRKKSEID